MIEKKYFENGFAYLEVTNTHATAKIALQGAHLFAYQRTNEAPLLWVSKKSYFQKGKAIRGGVPVCFPWFGKHPTTPSLPQHGFGRISFWEIVSQKELEDGSTEIVFGLGSSKTTHEIWDYAFDVKLTFRIGERLTMILTTTNTDTNPFTLSSALHSYFAVSHIENISIKGLEGCTYYNNLDGQFYTQSEPLTINQEVDRVYATPHDRFVLRDDSKEITILQEGSNSVVVWNPWQTKASKMSDMQDDGYETFVCIESANAREDRRIIEAGQSHTLKATIF